MISGNLEYLVSSLPHLSFTQDKGEQERVSSILTAYAGVSETTDSLSHILEEEAAKYLNSEQYGLLRQIHWNTIHRSPFRNDKNIVISTIADFMYDLKESIARLRLLRRQYRGAPPASENPTLWLMPGTPLEEELQIMQLQWETLDALSAGYFADFEAMVIYKLKLILLSRVWSFDQATGWNRFVQITKEY